jgi:hypothetical protein
VPNFIELKKCHSLTDSKGFEKKCSALVELKKISDIWSTILIYIQTVENQNKKYRQDAKTLDYLRHHL